MSSSKSSYVYDDDEPMELMSDDEIGPIVEIIYSDSEMDPDEDPEYMLDEEDFQPFAFPNGIMEDDALVDDVLPFRLHHLHEMIVIDVCKMQHINYIK
ncbi:hypothetical protein Hanom_Chr05g00404681 [Helianthus anomalus]